LVVTGFDRDVERKIPFHSRLHNQSGGIQDTLVEIVVVVIVNDIPFLSIFKFRFGNSIYVKNPNQNQTPISNGYLGCHNDEERSKAR